MFFVKIFLEKILTNLKNRSIVFVIIVEGVRRVNTDMTSTFVQRIAKTAEEGR